LVGSGSMRCIRNVPNPRMMPLRRLVVSTVAWQYPPQFDDRNLPAKALREQTRGLITHRVPPTMRRGNARFGTLRMHRIDPEPNHPKHTPDENGPVTDRDPRCLAGTRTAGSDAARRVLLHGTTLVPMRVPAWRGLWLAGAGGVIRDRRDCHDQDRGHCLHSTRGTEQADGAL